MSAQALPTAHPPWAIHCWSDERSIFVELPCTDGPPYILSYPLSEAGLSKAIWLMRSVYEKQKPTPPANYTTHPKVRYAKGTSQATEAQRESARRVLSGLKIIP